MPATITNPNGAFGQTAGAPNQGHTVLPFKSAETTVTIAAGEVVSINTAGDILQATTAVDVNLCIGVAVERITPGNTGLVAVGGKVTNVKAQGAIAAGAVVTRSGTTAGTVMDGTTAETGVIGVAYSAAASSLVNVFLKQS